MNSDAKVGCLATTPFMLLAFLSGLKIGGVIDWSWFWIASIVWIPGFFLLFWGIFAMFVVHVLYDLMNEKK